MRLVAVRTLAPGDVLARTLHAADGRVLLAAGVRLSEQHIKRIRELQVPAAWVEDELSEGISPGDLIHEATRIEALRVLREVLRPEVVQRGIPGPLFRRASRVVDDLLDDLRSSRDALYGLTDVRAPADYACGHALAVAVLAARTGMSLGYGELRLKRLALGAFLHDLGTAALPEAVLAAPRQLTPDEFQLVQRHPQLGFEALRRTDGVQPAAAVVALEHHERWDGSGYPRGLAGDSLHEHSRVVAVADVFDAMTSDRPYRPRWQPSDALDHLQAGSGLLFDPVAVEAFTQNVTAFPQGTAVQLGSGAVGLVVRAHRAWPTRPVVRLLTEPDGQRLPVPRDVDLAASQDDEVVGPATWEDPRTG